MGKSFSTVLLAIGALIMVGAGAFLITTTALSDDDADNGSNVASGGGEQHVYLTNLGMTWRSCAGAVASQLESFDGVTDYEVDHQSDFAEVWFDGDQVSIDEILDGLESIGYRPQSYRDAPEES